MKMILEKLKLVPHKPGCYLMKNKDGVIIYVGKAKDLKNRLNSYFHASHTGKTARLVKEINDFDYIVVSSETESLILEINLIKKHDPKYNILLRDDKSYPYIELTQEKCPRLQIVRNLHKKRNTSRLFGPYPNVTAARETVNLLNRIYPLKKCKTFPKKPCLYYHIDQCLGYCVKDIPKEKIDTMEKEIIHFLKGDDEEVKNKIQTEMEKLSENLMYEKALELKKLLDYINITLVKQKIEINDDLSRDVFGMYSDGIYLSIFILFIRSSKICGHHHQIIPLIDTYSEELTRYIAKFYEKALLPKEILIPQIEEEKLLKDYLKISVKVPEKGVKKDAHLFGTYTVSGMVVFIDGIPAKNEYRKYKLQTDKIDDYSSMKEVIYRRYFRVLKDGLTKPDLIIIDGGLGQLNAANEIITSLNIDVKIIGLKKDDKHSTNALITLNGEIPIEKRSNLFHYLERMQDEVHNYTINYHRQIRSKGMLSSILDEVPGIGTKRKEELLKKYKSINGIKNADKKELEKIIPENIAVNLKKILNELDK